MGLVVVENGKGQIVDIGRNAEAEHEHQKRRTEQRETEPDRVAQQFQRLSDRTRKQPPWTEGRRTGDCRGGRRFGNWFGWFRSRRSRRFEVADEGLFEG